MAGGIIAFSSGTAATLERQKPSYGRSINDVCRGNLTGLPDRLKDVVQRMHDSGAKAGAGAKINDVLAVFAGTGNQFIMNTASRLAEAAEAGVFDHPDAHGVMKELMRQCPAGADSVPKMLADLKHELGGGFYGLKAADITRIAGRSMRASASHCPNEIHRKMTELTIRGEFDHIPQMHQLRMEKAAAPQQAVAIDGFAACAIATQAPGIHMEVRAVQAGSDVSFTSAEKQILPKPMEFKAAQQMQNKLRSTPLTETVIVKDAVQRFPRAANQPAREPVFKTRDEQRAPAKQAPEPQAKIPKPVAAVAGVRREASKEPARSQIQEARPVPIDAQHRIESKKEKILKAPQCMIPLPEAGRTSSRELAKPPPLGRLRKKLRATLSRMRELARSARNKIAEKRADAKKRRGLKPAAASRFPKKKGKNASAAAIVKKKVKIILPFRLWTKKDKPGKGRVVQAHKKTASQAHVPAAFHRTSRLPLRRGRNKARFLKYLIAPGFFLPRRQRKGSAVRPRNPF